MTDEYPGEPEFSCSNVERSRENTNNRRVAENTTSAGNRKTFAPEMLRTILGEVIKDQRTKLPKSDSSDLNGLARALNGFQLHFKFATEVANESKVRAKRVSCALAALEDFFEERRVACETGDAFKPEISENERHLRGQFDSFLKAFDTHRFDLLMDAGLLMPTITKWHPFAESIANHFKTAMAHANGGRTFGLSNGGPVARFVAAVIPHITGENPSVGAVSKHLKDRARQRRNEPKVA